VSSSKVQQTVSRADIHSFVGNKKGFGKPLKLPKANTDKCRPNCAFFLKLFYFIEESLFHKENLLFILKSLEATISFIYREFLEFADPDLTQIQA
jgi:hypothetical protein